MSLFCLKTHDLSWQDRTINIELMMAPARSQLLYNKHKGLNTKCDQESNNLDRERDSYLKSHKTDIRLMERRKDLYSKRRNDIILRRSAITGRRAFSGDAGRTSAPPRLESEAKLPTSGTFITDLGSRQSKSAQVGVRQPLQPEDNRLPDMTKLYPHPEETPDGQGTVSPCVSRSPTPGRPYLMLRQKSVRFQPSRIGCAAKTPVVPIETPIDDRIQSFLSTQAEFNKTGPQTVTDKKRRLAGKPPLIKRVSGIELNMCKLESAFDDFITENSTEGLQKLVKYATKMKAKMRNARNSEIHSVLVS